MAYSAYGELLTEKVSGYGYNGEYYDAATGMLNLRARQYEPAQARFSQRDSLKGSAASPRSLNAYLYCQNDAINFFDASGAAMMAVNMTDGGGGRKSDTSPSNFFRKANQTIKTAVTRAVNSAAEAAKAAQQSALTQAQISSILKESRNPANVWEKARANRAQAQASTPTVSGRSFLRSTPLTACMTQEEYDDYWIIYGVDMPFDTPSPTPQPTPKPMSPSTSLTEQIYAARKEPNRTKRIIKTTSVFINAVIHAIKDDVDDVDLTYSDGITGSLSPTGVFAYSGSLFVSFDTKGNVAIQYSKDGAIMTGDVSISASGFGSITNAPTVDDLNGPYYSIGGSYATIIEGIPIYAGGDAIIMYNAEMDEYYVGALERVGVANPGAEFHVSWGETGTLWEINIVDCIDQINEMILEW